MLTKGPGIVAPREILSCEMCQVKMPHILDEGNSSSGSVNQSLNIGKWATSRS